MLNIQTLRKGFTLVEILLVLGIVSVVGGISVPLYREFQIRNDLNLAMEQTVQGLRRAQILSQAAQNDDEWGFYVPAGTLYKGRSYETRDVAYDEVYPMPSNIGTTGLLEVSYAKTSGKANDTGTITLHAANDETRSIVVEVISEGVATTLNDNFSICHHPPGNPENSNTLSISDSAWPSHESHGDTLGACPGDPDPDSEESSSSSSSSAASNSSGISSAQSSAGGASSGGGSSAGGGGGGGSCEDR
ncbi:MAG: type II secretion system protein, partial [Patescibacteria group bacterium]